jgi:hypothetical protein
MLDVGTTTHAKPGVVVTVTGIILAMVGIAVVVAIVVALSPALRTLSETPVAKCFSEARAGAQRFK